MIVCELWNVNNVNSGNVPASFNLVHSYLVPRMNTDTHYIWSSLMVIRALHFKPALPFTTVGSLTFPLPPCSHLPLVNCLSLLISLPWTQRTSDPGSNVPKESVAPLKTRQPHAKTEPWFNDTTQAVRRSVIELNANGRGTNCMCLFKS